MVFTKQIYFLSTFVKSLVHISDDIEGVVGGSQEEVYVQRKRRRSFPLSNNYLDDVLTLELQGLEKTSNNLL